jgi:hypothetical protein
VGTVSAGGSQGAGDQNLLRFAKEVSNQGTLFHNHILVLLDCDVAGLPVDSDRIFYRKIPHDDTNAVFKKGIENLLPSEVAQPQFYDESVKIDDYGAQSTVRKINKQRLCDAVCDGSVELPIAYAERIGAFEPIIALIREAIDPA